MSKSKFCPAAAEAYPLLLWVMMTLGRFFRLLGASGVFLGIVGLMALAARATSFELLLPSFDYTATFLGPSGVGLLRGEETGLIRVDLLNLEDHVMKEVRVSFKALAPRPGLPVEGSVELTEIAPHATKSIDIVIQSDRGLESGSFDYVLEVAAASGSYGPPARISFLTIPFVPPQLELARIELKSAAKGSASARTIFVTAAIRNSQGLAKAVRCRFFAMDSMINLVATASQDLGSLTRGQIKEAAFVLEVPSTYRGPADLPVWVEVKELHPDLGFCRRLPLRYVSQASSSQVITQEL